VASALTSLLLSRIARNGPITVAEFMEAALYHPEYGYYARAPQRSGREGDFFTSVDVGPLFGEMLALQIDEIRNLLNLDEIDLVEGGAGNGRLTRDILAAAADQRLEFLPRSRVALVERSAAARAAHPATFASLGLPMPVTSRDDLPPRISGVIFANELLDALPVHVVETTQAGLEEIYVGSEGAKLVEVRGPLSTAAIAEYVAEVGVEPPRGTRIEVGLAAVQWIAGAAAALERGIVLLFDYGHEARELYSAVHASGTLTTYRRHSVGARHWLEDPGESDLTAHVNLTAIRGATERAGLEVLGMVDQMYFLIALGILDRLPDGSNRQAISRRLAAKSLIMPGGLGSTMKVMAFAKNSGRPALRGVSSGRLT
jgi:SAM-dependent MidA family methyltransferase